jgi:hypothetical protein
MLSNQPTAHLAVLVVVTILVTGTVAPGPTHHDTDSRLASALTDAHRVDVGYFVGGRETSWSYAGAIAGGTAGCIAGGAAASPFGGVTAVGGCKVGAEVGTPIGAA